MDRSSSSSSRSKSPKVGIPYITKNLRLIDIWRVLHPLDKNYTCLSAAHGSLSRIDYMLTSASLFPRVLESICPSDHALCWVKISRSFERGPHIQWRFPSHLASSLKFREALLIAWTCYATDNVECVEGDPMLFWQASKSVRRGNILSYTYHRNKQLHESFTSLQTSLTSAYNKYKIAPTAANKEAYQAHKIAFEALLTQLELKHTFLARSKFHRFGNRSGKLLSSLLKGHHP